MAETPHERRIEKLRSVIDDAASYRREDYPSFTEAHAFVVSVVANQLERHWRQARREAVTEIRTRLAAGDPIEAILDDLAMPTTSPAQSPEKGEELSTK